MPKRRNVLIGLGGMVALAGCTGETDDEEPEEEEPEEEEETDTSDSQPEEEDESEEEEEADPPRFEFTNVEPDGETVSYGDTVELELTVENTGEEEGSQNIEYYLDDGLVDELEITLESEESEVITAGINTELHSEGELEYGFISEDDEITGSIEITIDQPATQSFSGSGQSVEDGIEIEGGLTVVEATHSGESNFQVSLEDDSEFGESFINVIGDFDGAQADLIDAGEYLLDVNADGSWSIDIHQPRSGSGESLPESLSGDGPDVVGPIEFDGTHVASGSHSGESNFQVQVYPMEGRFGETVFNEIGEFDGETTFSFDGVGWVDVNADGSWQMTME